MNKQRNVHYRPHRNISEPHERNENNSERNHSGYHENCINFFAQHRSLCAWKISDRTLNRFMFSIVRIIERLIWNDM